MRKRFRVVILAVGAALLLAACGSSSTSTAGSGTGSTAPTPTPTPSAACSPMPCAVDNDLTVAASLGNGNVTPGQYDTVPAGSYIVQVNVSYAHSTSAGQPANISPFDFQLQNPAGNQTDQELLFDTPGCDNDFNSQGLAPGGHAGPFSICFVTMGSPGDKLILIWTPDLFSNPIMIPLN